jgi:hypothetical protein
MQQTHEPMDASQPSGRAGNGSYSIACMAVYLAVADQVVEIIHCATGGYVRRARVRADT